MRGRSAWAAWCSCATTASRSGPTIERAALLDIGHDLGRATLNARTFEREHALVAELQALDTYKSQLIATVSHELKSPLTTVAGHLEMLESGTISIGDQARASLAAIGRASDRMSRVIEDLLLLRKVGETHKPLCRPRSTSRPWSRTRVGADRASRPQASASEVARRRARATTCSRSATATSWTRSCTTSSATR